MKSKKNFVTKVVDASRYAICNGSSDTDLRGKYLDLDGKVRVEYENAIVFMPFVSITTGTTINNGPVYKCPRTRARLSMLRMRRKYIFDKRRNKWRRS